MAARPGAHEVDVGLGAAAGGTEAAGVERDHIDIADPGRQGLHIVHGVQGLGEDRLDSLVLDDLGQLLESGRAGLSHARRRRDDSADELEPVAVGEVTERLVVGDQLAARGGKLLDVGGDLGVHRLQLGQIAGQACPDGGGVEAHAARQHLGEVR